MTNKINMAELLADRDAGFEDIRAISRRHGRIFDLEAAFIEAVKTLKAIVERQSSSPPVGEGRAYDRGTLALAEEALERING